MLSHTVKGSRQEMRGTVQRPLLFRDWPSSISGSLNHYSLCIFPKAFPISQSEWSTRGSAECFPNSFNQSGQQLPSAEVTWMSFLRSIRCSTDVLAITTSWSLCLWSLFFWLCWQKGKFWIIDHALIMPVLECLSWERFTSLVLHFTGDKLRPERSGDLLKDLWWVGGRDRI